MPSIVGYDDYGDPIWDNSYDWTDPVPGTYQPTAMDIFTGVGADGQIIMGADSGTYSNTSPNTYDAGGSSLDVGAFKAAQAVTQSAISGGTVDSNALLTMKAAGMDIGTVKTIGGAIWKLVTDNKGVTMAQPQNAQAQAAQAQAAQQKLITYGALAAIAFALIH